MFRATAVALAAAVAVPLTVTGLGNPPPIVSIRVAGEYRYVEEGTTLRQVMRAFGQHPKPGTLFDVDGRAIDRRADPGEVLVNGYAVPRTTALSTGDEVTVVDGVGRPEATRRVTTRLKGRQPGDPQYFLGTSRMIQVANEGVVSGKAVTVVYRPIGKPRHRPTVALTFDDGPWPWSTMRILHILKRFRAPATFFVIGRQANRYRWMVRREIEAGMTVGNHSWGHPLKPEFARLGPRRLHQEMAWTNHVLEKLGGDPKLMRPPGGSWNGRVVGTAQRLGLRLVNWNIDPHDWSASATRRSILHNVLANVRPGSIVLLHDGGGDQSATVRALPFIIRGIRRMGLRLVAVLA